MRTDKARCQQIDSSHYSREYFLTGCDGFEVFSASQGLVLPLRLKAIWNFLEASPGTKLLDLGCGRGEIVIHCGFNKVSGVGLDYSPAALALGQSALRQLTGYPGFSPEKAGFVLGDLKHLPFPDDWFDRVLMSDIVEHLTPSELDRTLGEVFRVLSPGGSLLIHTMPNLWYYRYGYPCFRWTQRVRGHRLPVDPRARHRFPHVHINEQTPPSLRRCLFPHGFRKIKVWLFDYHDYEQYRRPMGLIMKGLSSTPLIRNIFNNDIFAVAEK
jgi:ubiquinone/menaquinone biosynthesis C-methylase UbiE